MNSKHMVKKKKGWSCKKQQWFMKGVLWEYRYNTTGSKSVTQTVLKKQVTKCTKNKNQDFEK